MPYPGENLIQAMENIQNPMEGLTTKHMIATTSQNESYFISRVEKPDFRYFIDNKALFLIQKRLIDIILSLVIIIFFLSWMIPLIALAIKLNSRGPVFFIQRRVGRGLRSFGCIKFRTMVPNGQADKHVPSENDSRVTSLGKFLRRTSLDELPQFLNVLIGDMSIVGPRPHMFADCCRFADLIQDYKSRSMVRPGITGLAQIKGFRGPAEDSYSIRARYFYDLIYIKNLGWALDISIFFNTFSQVFGLLFFRKDAEKRSTGNVNADDRKIAA